MKKAAKKIIILSIGIVFIAAGVLGLFLPFLQGILFLLFGAFLLSLYFPKIYEWTEKHTGKYPNLQVKIKKFEAWARKFIGEI